MGVLGASAVKLYVMNITFIGGGNMAQAIIGGLLRAKKSTPRALHVVDVDAEVRQRVERAYSGVRCYEKTGGAIREGDIVLLAVKPQHAEAAVRRLDIETDAHLIISIAAGVTLQALAQWRKGHTRLVRAMPNTPALIGAGIAALYSFPGVSETDRQCADKILSAVGKTVWVKNEDEMNAVTAISGSGPAYVFLFMEAIERAAAELKLPRDVAHELTVQTFAGAARLAAESPDSLAVLRERVTSKGGTTEAALDSLAHDRIEEAIIRAIKAAHERARRLGKPSDKS